MLLEKKRRGMHKLSYFSKSLLASKKSLKSFIEETIVMRREDLRLVVIFIG